MAVGGFQLCEYSRRINHICAFHTPGNIGFNKFSNDVLSESAQQFSNSNVSHAGGHALRVSGFWGMGLGFVYLVCHFGQFLHSNDNTFSHSHFFCGSHILDAIHPCQHAINLQYSVQQTPAGFPNYSNACRAATR